MNPFVRIEAAVDGVGIVPGICGTSGIEELDLVGDIAVDGTNVPTKCLGVQIAEGIVNVVACVVGRSTRRFDEPFEKQWAIRIVDISERRAVLVRDGGHDAVVHSLRILTVARRIWTCLRGLENNVLGDGTIVLEDVQLLTGHSVG